MFNLTKGQAPDSPLCPTPALMSTKNPSSEPAPSLPNSEYETFTPYDASPRPLSEVENLQTQSSGMKVSEWLTDRGRFSRPYLIGMGPDFARNTLQSMQRMSTTSTASEAQARAEDEGLVDNEDVSTEETSPEPVQERDEERRTTWSEMFNRFMEQPREHEMWNIDGTRQYSRITRRHLGQLVTSAAANAGLERYLEESDEEEQDFDASELKDPKAHASSPELLRDDLPGPLRIKKRRLSSASRADDSSTDDGVAHTVITAASEDDASNEHSSDDDSSESDAGTTSSSCTIRRIDLPSGLENGNEVASISSQRQTRRLGNSGRLSDPAFASLHKGMMNEDLQQEYLSFEERLDKLLASGKITRDAHTRLMGGFRARQQDNAPERVQQLFDYTTGEKEREELRKNVRGRFLTALRDRMVEKERMARDQDAQSTKSTPSRVSIGESGKSLKSSISSLKKDETAKRNDLELDSLAEEVYEAIEKEKFEDEIECQIRLEEEHLDEESEDEERYQAGGVDRTESGGELVPPLLSPLPSPYIGSEEIPDVPGTAQSSPEVGRGSSKRAEGPNLYKHVFRTNAVKPANSPKL